MRSREIARGARNIKIALQRLRWRRLPFKGSSPTVGDHFRLLAGDFSEVTREVADGSIDLVIADPPWSRSWLPRLTELMTVAARVLRPGGRTLIFIGQEFLPQVLAAASDQLTYRWTLCLRLPKVKANWNGGVLSAWLPVVVLEKRGAKKPRDFRWDLLEEPQTSKADPWAKSERVMRELVEWFSAPGDRVLDLFCGSGSSAVAAVTCGRYFVGVDSSAAAVERTASEMKRVRWATANPTPKASGIRAYPV